MSVCRQTAKFPHSFARYTTACLVSEEAPLDNLNPQHMATNNFGSEDYSRWYLDHVDNREHSMQCHLSPPDTYFVVREQPEESADAGANRASEFENCKRTLRLSSGKELAFKQSDGSIIGLTGQRLTTEIPDLWRVENGHAVLLRNFDPKQWRTISEETLAPTIHISPSPNGVYLACSVNYLSSADLLVVNSKTGELHCKVVGINIMEEEDCSSYNPLRMCWFDDRTLLFSETVATNKAHPDSSEGYYRLVYFDVLDNKRVSEEKYSNRRDNAASHFQCIDSAHNGASMQNQVYFRGSTQPICAGLWESISHGLSSDLWRLTAVRISSDGRWAAMQLRSRVDGEGSPKWPIPGTTGERIYVADGKTRQVKLVYQTENAEQFAFNSFGWLE